MDNFCVKGTSEPKCYSIETIAFNSEEQIVDVILDLLKSELPARLQNIKDCQDKPMFIAEDSIDIIPPEKFRHLDLILEPVGDKPTYLESRLMRTVVYNFQLILTVSNPLARCVYWELIRFKNAVEELIMATELYIDGYEGVYIDPLGTQYIPLTFDEGVYRRQGAYRFSVTVTQNKI